MQTPHDIYLKSQVLSASPQRLRLLLIDGAIRFGKQATQLWDADRWDEATDALARCREIVEELLQSIDAESSPLAKRVADLYLFLFQALAEAQIRHDQTRLSEVLGILESERETWRQVCEQDVSDTAHALETSLSSLRQIDDSELTKAGGFSADA